MKLLRQAWQGLSTAHSRPVDNPRIFLLRDSPTRRSIPLSTAQKRRNRAAQATEIPNDFADRSQTRKAGCPTHGAARKRSSGLANCARRARRTGCPRRTERRSASQSFPGSDSRQISPEAGGRPFPRRVPSGSGRKDRERRRGRRDQRPSQGQQWPGGRHAVRSRQQCRQRRDRSAVSWRPLARTVPLAGVGGGPSRGRRKDESNVRGASRGHGRRTVTGATARHSPCQRWTTVRAGSNAGPHLPNRLPARANPRSSFPLETRPTLADNSLQNAKKG